MTSSALWQPDRAKIDQSGLAQFTDYINDQHNLLLETYSDLWQWSIDEPELFWSGVWNYCSVIKCQAQSGFQMLR